VWDVEDFSCEEGVQVWSCVCESEGDVAVGVGFVESQNHGCECG
jgi:hypothetical protein